MKSKWIIPLLTFLVVGYGCTQNKITDNKDSQSAVTEGNVEIKMELKQTYWRLLVLGENNIVERNDSESEPHFVLQEDNQVIGSDGCNRFLGQYHQDKQTLTFIRLISTRMDCAKGMQQADQFMHALSQAKYYQIVDDIYLDLLDSQQRFLLRFDAVALQ